MNVTAEQFEVIVQEVVRRLSGDSIAVAVPPDPSTWRFSGKVLSMSSLSGQLNGIRCVQVDRRAIVTPAVVDELKQRSIRLVRQGVPRTETNVIDLVQIANARAERIQRQLARSNMTIRFHQISSVSELGSVVDQFAIAIASRPYEATCHANRDKRICAVHAINRDVWCAACCEIQPNVAVCSDQLDDDDLLNAVLNTVRSKKGRA